MPDQIMHSPAAPPPWAATPAMGLTMREAARALGSLVVAQYGDADRACERICNDSRLVGTGDAFIALASATRDGHDFIGDALARDAAFVIVSRWPLP